MTPHIYGFTTYFLYIDYSMCRPAINLPRLSSASSFQSISKKFIFFGVFWELCHQCTNGTASICSITTPTFVVFKRVQTISSSFSQMSGTSQLGISPKSYVDKLLVVTVCFLKALPRYCHVLILNFTIKIQVFTVSPIRDTLDFQVHHFFSIK